MRIRTSTIAAAVLAGGAAVAIAAAPAALAQPSCVQTGQGGGIVGGANTVCQSPGNSQIDSTPSVYPQQEWEGGFPWGYGPFVL
jgi:hypothetical protein